MKYVFMILLILCVYSCKAEITDCEFSPVALSNSEDWKKFKIEEWHNCFGELHQNYKNKKKWIAFFKNGLPNGYGTVKYDNSSGYYKGFFLNGKIHGEGRFIDNNGNKLNLKCYHNTCQNFEKSISQNIKLNSHNSIDFKYKNIQTNYFLDYKEKFYTLNEFNKKNSQSHALSENLKINNISTINEIMNINKFIFNNQIKPSIQSKQIISTEKIIKYIK